MLQVCPSGCPYTTIQSAIDAAPAGGGIAIGAGTYAENLTIGKSLVITGAGAASTIIDGGGQGSVVTVLAGANVSLQNVTLTNGAAPSGGGVRNLGTLLLSGNDISNNNATIAGGGISNEAGAVLTIATGAVVGNTAGNRGGGIANQTGAQTTLRDMSIKTNTTSGQGGGLYFSSGALDVKYSSIEANVAADGGGVSIAGGVARMSFAHVDANHVGQRGGGFFIAAGTLSVDNSGITQNGVGVAKGGGAFFNQRGRVTVQNSLVDQNSSPQCVNVSC